MSQLRCGYCGCFMREFWHSTPNGGYWDCECNNSKCKMIEKALKEEFGEKGEQHGR